MPPVAMALFRLVSKSAISAMDRTLTQATAHSHVKIRRAVTAFYKKVRHATMEIKSTLTPAKTIAKSVLAVAMVLWT